MQEAWVGDAVLALYVRRWILTQDGQVNGEKYERMTSNQFLNAFGEASAVEAELGRVYMTEGLDVAFKWIEERLLPLFQKQEVNRDRKSTSKKRG